MALKRIWFASDQMCSKKLKAAIPLWLPFYETVYQALTPETQARIGSDQFKYLYHKIF